MKLFRVVLPVLALGANTQILQLAAEDAIIARIIIYPPRKIKGRAVNIVHSAALDATNVVVWPDISVEARFPAAEVQLLDRAQPGKQLQIPVDGSETESWKPATDNLVKTGSGRVRCEPLKFLENHLPLPGMSSKRVALHN